MLDKILHNEYLLADEILRAENCIFPIMAREAISSVSSMVTSLPGRFKKTNPHSDDILGMAADYYRKRLDMLSHYAEMLARLGRCWYFTYDDLLALPAEVFRMLEQCLELHHTLSERYATGPKTGIHGYGDPSENIKRGYIDRSIARDPIVIPEQLAETAASGTIDPSMHICAGKVLALPSNRKRDRRSFQQRSPVNRPITIHVIES